MLQRTYWPLSKSGLYRLSGGAGMAVGGRLATGRTVRGSNVDREKEMFSSSYPSGPALGPTQPPLGSLPGFFPRGKAAMAWR